MFRLKRLRSSIPPPHRVPIRRYMQMRMENPHPLPNIRITKPLIRWKRTFWALLTAYYSYQIFRHIVIRPFFKALEEIPVPEEEVKEEDNTLFIPFIGTTKELERRPYRASDPEWKGYHKFNNDPALTERTKDELANIVRSYMSEASKIKPGEQVVLRRRWLEHDYPLKAPPTFNRSGIEITETNIRWTSKPVPSSTVSNIRKYMWPGPFAQSLWALTKVIAMDKMDKTARMMGLQNNSSLPNIDQAIAQQQEMAKRLEASKKSPSSQPLGMGKASVSAKPSGDDKKLQQVNQSRTGPPPPTNTEASRAVLAFRKKFSEIKKRQPVYGPSGSINIRGLVQLDVANNFLVTLSVSAAWDPKTQKYDLSTLRMSVWNLKKRVQAPLA